MSCSYTQRSSGQGCVTPWKVRQSITAPFTELTQTSIQTHLDHRIMWSQMFFFLPKYCIIKSISINKSTHFINGLRKKTFPIRFLFPNTCFHLHSHAQSFLLQLLKSICAGICVFMIDYILKEWFSEATKKRSHHKKEMRKDMFCWVVLHYYNLKT